MTSPCDDLLGFIDGELDATQGDAFREHLRTCSTCPARLIDALQVTARLDALADLAHAAEPHDPPAQDGDEQIEPDARAPSARPEVPIAIHHVRPGRSRRQWLTIGASSALAALVVVVVVHLISGPPPDAFRDVASRPFDLRFAYADARAYKPLRGELRGEGGPAGGRISHRAIAALEDRDAYGAAIAMAWNGEPTSEVITRLGKLPQTAAIQSDLTVVQNLTTTPDNLETALASFAALRRSDDPAAARAARWNDAVLRARLQLPFSAAQAFLAIVSDLEPGWAAEAWGRAVSLRAGGDQAWNRWQRATAEGDRLLRTGEPVSLASLQAAPGLMRAYLYNAVRSAPSRERVLALAPMAAALDRRGPPVLRDYVAQTAALDFARRAPLASSYGKLLTHAPVTAEDKQALLVAEPSSEVADIVMGAMVELDAVPDHLAWFRDAAELRHDPWFDVILAKAAAERELQHGDWLAAEARLREGERACSPATTYQCLDLAVKLGKLYQDLHRVPEALAVLRTAIELARDSNELGRYRALLWRLADVEQLNSSPATARAYAMEILAMPTTTSYRRSTYLLLAGAATLELDGPAARQALDAALALGPGDLDTANLLADIARLDPRHGDVAQVRDWLRSLRSPGALSAADLVLADETEGRAVIEQDSPAGIALIERAIAQADAHPQDVAMQRARAGGYSVLAFDAVRRQDLSRVVALIARELGLAVPRSCAVAMAAEDERAVVVARGPDGVDRAVASTRRAANDRAVAIPAPLAGALAGCASVKVMARAALQGQPRVLPPELAWSYAAEARERSTPAHGSQLPARTLIVTDVIPPEYLHLPALVSRPVASSAVALRGAQATPGRVLAEMSDATEIQFHTHARVDVGVSDAAHLVLSPEEPGKYALTAEEIRRSDLHGRPVVVLAACHSALGARYEHVAWSLPDAFLAAGARAVFAVGTAVPDVEAGPFFDRVLLRVRAGADPAVALRDERMSVLASEPASWVNDVILFE